MESEKDSKNFTKETILQDIIHILEDMTSDWDMDMDINEPIGSETKLIAGLGFESVDVVQFTVAIEECFKRRDLPVEELLMIDGVYVDEIKVEDVVSFLSQHLNDQ